MDGESRALCFAIAVIFSMGGFAGYGFGKFVKQRDLQQQAIRVGVAEYDPQTGEFRWKGK